MYVDALFSSIPHQRHCIVSREQLGLLKNQFKALANEEMVLDFDSFKNLLRKLPTLSGNEEMLDVFCTAFDSNGDGEIEFKEFTAGLSTIFQGSTDERLRCML